MASQRVETDDWSSGPGTVFSPHSHPYHKTLTCRSGSIVFNLLKTGKTLRLKTGEVLELPPGTLHSAVAGPEGVSCSEIHRYGERT